MPPPTGQTSAPRPIRSGLRFVGRVRVPPSKSLTNRYLNLALLSSRTTVLERPLLADDTRRFLMALERLGFRVTRTDGAEVRIEPPEEPPGSARINCGASGTMARFLIAALAVRPGEWRLDGRDRLRERPMGELVAALARLGGRFEYEGRSGFLPLSIRGGTVRSGVVRLEAGESSQFLSALLMAATRAAGEVAIEVGSLASAPYVDLTTAAMEAFGATVELPSPGVYRVRPQRLEGGRFRVAGDDSAAGYPAAAAALTGGRVELVGLERRSRQGDRRFLELLEEAGATLSWDDEDVLTVSGGRPLSAFDADFSAMPDQVPTAAALAPFARGDTSIRNVAHLRLKESDRLAAVAEGLRTVGAAVEEGADGLTIPGVWAGREPPTSGALISTHRDHRIAMSFAVLGLRRPGVRIADPGVVVKSYPGFWADFEGCLGP